MSTPNTRRPEACPICGAPSVAAFAPFCRQGCRDRDLLNWLGESYRAPGPGSDAEIGDDGLDSGGHRPL